MLSIGSLFSGVGGIELGLEWAGLGPVRWQVENDEYCRKVLKRHWPEARRFGDVRKVRAEQLEPVDLICGGFPCTDVSVAGRGAGLSGARSGLWYEMLRLIRDLRPAFAVVENVAGGARRWVDAVIGQLAELGYATLPIPLEARYVGAPHRRARIFIAAAHPQRLVLWKQQRWSCGTSREGALQLAKHGSKGTTADANGKRKLQSEGSKPSIWRRSDRRHLEDRGVDWWSAEPNVGRVVHGISSRMDRHIRRQRERALGNSVVPACAHVVGEVIKQLSDECYDSDR